MNTHCSASDTRDEASPPHLAERHVPGTILIVEDEPEILAPLSHTLKRAGYLVLEAEDGLTACRVIGSQRPDLILLDILLPDLNGWEVCRLLRQHPEPSIANIPVIMLTALNTTENKLYGLELGADAYLPKPYSQQEVLLVSGKLIDKHRRQLELEERVATLSESIERQQDLHHLLFHELRNQLTILHGFTALLQEDGGIPGDARLTAIHRSSSYLQDLAEDFLLIRKVRDSRLQLPSEPLLVDELIAEIVELYRPAARLRGIALEQGRVGDGRVAHVNRPALKIILSTLLDNAIKYGPAHSPVSVTCHYQERHIELKVCDAGSGIDLPDREQLFERFHRGTGHAPGSGLGLYGTRVLSRAMGGDADYDEDCRHGCCIRVWIPLSPACEQNVA